jgi:GT2 family glycosyltransferase/O-antigen/teichoic acid export membrane protein
VGGLEDTALVQYQQAESYSSPSALAMPTVTVIICAYTMDRWTDIVRAIESVQLQTHRVDQLILVSDHNDRLFEAVSREFQDIDILSNSETKGLSGARNTGVAAARSDIVAFLDDDAAADREWVAGMLWHYSSDPEVFGVGGSAAPVWADSRPSWLPLEFDWVIGCTYRGQPQSVATVRNLMGCNMSFKREVFDLVGGFSSSIGRVGKRPLGCEETELCIRLRQRVPTARIIYDPALIVAHRVSRDRERFRYFASRCYGEGLSKAMVSTLVGRDALQSERSYVGRVLPLAVLAGLRDTVRFRPSGLLRSLATVTGLLITTTGYMRGRTHQARRRRRTARGVRSAEPADHTSFQATRVATLDIEEGPDRLLASIRDPDRYARANILARLNGRPLGVVELAIPLGGLAGADVMESVAAQFGLPVSEVRNAPLDHQGPALRATFAQQSQTHPKVSVIIATCDRPSRLRRCLESVLDLRYPNFEVIVADNAPELRETAELVRSEFLADNRVRYLAVPQRGSSRARNAGAGVALGTLFAFTDDDVVVDPDWLEHLVQCFDSPDVGAATGLVRPMYLDTPAQAWFEQYGGFGKGFDRTTYGAKAPGAGPRSFYPYAGGTYGSGNNFCVRADAFWSLGAFDVNLGPGTRTCAGEDLAVFVKIVSSGWGLVYEPAALVHHEHRDTVDALERQLYGYGVGIAAMLTSLAATDSGHARGIVKRIPRGVYEVLSASSSKNRARTADYPRRLARQELTGILVGPIQYIRARVDTRRSRGRMHREAQTRGTEAAGTERRDRMLFRNAIALLVTTAITSILGVLYWLLAARNYSVAEMGTANAEIAATQLLSGLAQLNLVAGLPRFVPTAGVATRSFVLRSYAVTVALSVGAGCAFVALLPNQAYLHPLGVPSALMACWFVLAVAVWSVFTLQDSVLIGLRQALWVPLENGVFALVKIALLLMFAGSQHLGIFASWTIPVVATLLPVNALIFRKLIPRHVSSSPYAVGLPSPRDLRRYLATDYLGSTLQLSTTYAMPVIVSAVLGSVATGYFSAAWTVVLAFELVLTNIGTSLLVEGAHDPSAVPSLVRKLLRLVVVAVVPALLFTAVFARDVLGLLGKGYAEHGTVLLRLLVLAIVGRIVSTLFISICRIQRRVRLGLVVQAAMAAGILGGGIVLLHPLGIDGVGLAYAGTSVVVGLALLPKVLREVRISPSAESVVTRTIPSEGSAAIAVAVSQGR